MAEVESLFGWPVETEIDKAAKSRDYSPIPFRRSAAGPFRMVRVVCLTCGCGFAHRQTANGRRRRFCSAECRHTQELAWKARWRAAERERRSGEQATLDPLPLLAMMEAADAPTDASAAMPASAAAVPTEYSVPVEVVAVADHRPLPFSARMDAPFVAPTGLAASRNPLSVELEAEVKAGWRDRMKEPPSLGAGRRRSTI